MSAEDTTKYIHGKLLQEHRRGLDAYYRTEIFTEHGVHVAVVDLCPEDVPNGQVYLRGGTARRLVACWNACRGIPTEQLERGGLEMPLLAALSDIRLVLGVDEKPMLSELAGTVKDLRMERDELLAVSIKKSDYMDKLTAERDAAIARAERADADAGKFCAEAVRAEDALRHLYDLHARGIFSLPDEHYIAITDAAVVLSNALPTDTSKMVGERERRLLGALTPSAETKAAYMGEFSFRAHESNDVGEEFTRSFTVPWTTIKEIMKAIRKRAALAQGEKGE